MDFVTQHPTLTALLASAVCLLASRQDASWGSRATAGWWQFMAVFMLAVLLGTSIAYGWWPSAAIACASLFGELWLARRWWRPKRSA